jgi:hypothetical protein
VHDRGHGHVVQHALHGGAYRPGDGLAVARGSGGGGAGQVEEVLALGVVQLQGPGDGGQHALRGAADVAALQPRVVVEAHAGEHGDLLAAQPGYPPVPAEVGDARLLRGDVRAAGDQELPHLGLGAHGPHGMGGLPGVGGSGRAPQLGLVDRVPGAAVRG